MRNAFIETLFAQAERDERIWLLCGDLGYSVLERFAQRYPNRFVNIGVAEQNMIGVAAGLALSGKIVFVYSIANFPVMRPLEQIRLDVCYHNLPVKIVSVGGGLAYGPAGYSHHAVEDLAVMRGLPNMTVLAPGDPVEAKLATEAIVKRPGPCYLRLGKAGEPVVHAEPPVFEIGKAILCRQGRDITLISTGGVLQSTVAAADQLRQEGCAVRVLSMHTVQPLDEDAVESAARETGALITIEEHGPGGLGSAVGEVLARLGQPTRFIPLRLAHTAVNHAGSQETLRTLQGLSVQGIVATAQSLS